VTDRIAVVCTDRSHEGRTVVVERFTRGDPSTGGWIQQGGLTQANWRRKIRPAVLAALRPPFDLRGPVPSTKLRCDLCGLDVSVRTINLWVALDKIAEARIWRVQLATIASMLT
jgi:hypothetical protein